MSHYKIAYFYDDEENWVYTNGSANFSFGGLVTNGEKINLVRSWIDFIETDNEIDNKNKQNKKSLYYDSFVL